MPTREKTTGRTATAKGRAADHRSGDPTQECRECGEPTRNADRYHYGCTPTEVYLGALFR